MTRERQPQYRNARAAVIDILSTRPATYVELAALAGASSSTIEKVCILLRAEGHPCMVNVVRLRATHLRHAQVVPPSPASTVEIVRTSIESRSDLERAWMGVSA